MDAFKASQALRKTTQPPGYFGDNGALRVVAGGIVELPRTMGTCKEHCFTLLCTISPLRC